LIFIIPAILKILKEIKAIAKRKPSKWNGDISSRPSLVNKNEKPNIELKTRPAR
jgi:hypothetical protein